MEFKIKREFEEGVQGKDPFFPLPKQEEKDGNGKGIVCYYQGDKAVYTGKAEIIHGGCFYEIKMIAGRFKGETKVVKTSPGSRINV